MLKGKPLSLKFVERLRDLDQLDKAQYIVHELWGPNRCLLYTSDAADERSSVDLGGRRIIKQKTKKKKERTKKINKKKNKATKRINERITWRSTCTKNKIDN